MHGVRPGFSLDLTGNDPDGDASGFSERHARQKAIHEFDDDQFEMLILSPICGPFSPLQNLIYAKMYPEEVGAKLKEGVTDLKFAMLMCLKQVEQNEAPHVRASTCRQVLDDRRRQRNHEITRSYGCGV